MKTSIKFCVFLLLFAIGSLKAQTKIAYEYDNNGNRTTRKLVIEGPNPGSGNQTGREAAKPEEGKQIALQHGLSVFPNPTQDKVMLTLNNVIENESTSVLVTDDSGRKMYSAENLQEQSQIDMSSFQQGIYFVKVSMGKDVLIYKVLKVQ